MANLGLIDCKIGMYIKVNENNGPDATLAHEHWMCIPRSIFIQF